MNLFINAVSKSGVLILFDTRRHILYQENIEILWNESSKLTYIIDQFLSLHHVNYQDIDHIVVVHGPGSFTGVRAICLLVNTIAFSTWCHLTPISYFDLFTHYPITKYSSKRDMFIALSQPHLDGKNIQIMSHEDIITYLENNSIKILYWESPVGWSSEIVEKIDYSRILTQVVFENHTQIQPLYIKKPNIC